MEDEFQKTRIPKFRRFVLQNFPFIEQDFDALTDYALICKVIEYLNKVIESTNATSAQVEVLTNSFNLLKQYVDNYFDNLDVQEEINNKLEEMAEDGSLAELVDKYLGYNVKISDNFTITSSKIQDEARNLEYVITRISPNTEKIDHVPLKGAFSGGSIEAAMDDTRDFISNIARDKNAVLISNADTIGDFTYRKIIRDGVVVNDSEEASSWCIGITEDGELKCYASSVSTDILLNQWHIVNSWGGCVLMLDGEAREDLWIVNEDTKNEQHPRTLICQEFNSKDIVFLHIAGRKVNSDGVTYAEAVSLISSILPTVNVAYMFGGGGDTQLMINGLIQNDCNDATLRPIWDWIYLDANIDSENYNNVEKEIANGRNTNYTIHELLDTFLPHDFTYLSSQRILTAHYRNDHNTFCCDLDYNTDAKDQDSFLVKFGDMSEEGINTTLRIRLNLHYNDEYPGNSTYVDWEYSGRVVFPLQVKNKIVRVKFDKTRNRYLISEDLTVQCFVTETDLNTITTDGIYYSNQFTNKPGNESGWFATITHPQQASYKVQFFVARPSGKLYVRTCENNVFGNWKRYSFEDEVVLNFPEVYSTTGSKDLDNFNNGKTRIAYSYLPDNRPVDSDSGWIINIPRSDQATNATKYAIQIYMDRGTQDHGNMYIRQQENEVWTSWKKVTLS